MSVHSFDPELIVYNAGTDILDGDPLGRLKVISFIDLFGQREYHLPPLFLVPLFMLKFQRSHNLEMQAEVFC